MTCEDIDRAIKDQPIDLRSILGSLLERIESLEEKNHELELIVEFHKLKIPLKYRGSGLLGGDKSLFRTMNKFKTSFPAIENISSKGTGGFPEEIPMPKDPKEYTKAKERMLEYAKEKDKIVEKYFRVSDYDGKVYIEDTTDEAQADKCVEEGGVWYDENDIEKYFPHENRIKIIRYRRVMPKSSEA